LIVLYPQNPGRTTGYEPGGREFDPRRPQADDKRAATLSGRAK